MLSRHVDRGFVTLYNEEGAVMTSVDIVDITLETKGVFDYEISVERDFVFEVGVIRILDKNVDIVREYDFAPTATLALSLEAEL